MLKAVKTAKYEVICPNIEKRTADGKIYKLKKFKRGYFSESQSQKAGSGNYTPLKKSTAYIFFYFKKRYY